MCDVMSSSKPLTNSLVKIIIDHDKNLCYYDMWTVNIIKFIRIILEIKGCWFFSVYLFEH